MKYEPLPKDRVIRLTKISQLRTHRPQTLLERPPNFPPKDEATSVNPLRLRARNSTRAAFVPTSRPKKSLPGSSSFDPWLVRIRESSVELNGLDNVIDHAANTFSRNKDSNELDTQNLSRLLEASSLPSRTSQNSFVDNELEEVAEEGPDTRSKELPKAVGSVTGGTLPPLIVREVYKERLKMGVNLDIYGV